MIPPIVIRDKNTHELNINVNPMSKKLKFSHFMDVLCSDKKKLRKVGEKQSIMSLSMWDREISPSGSEFYQGLGKPCP